MHRRSLARCYRCSSQGFVDTLIKVAMKSEVESVRTEGI